MGAMIDEKLDPSIPSPKFEIGDGVHYPWYADDMPETLPPFIVRSRRWDESKLCWMYRCSSSENERTNASDCREDRLSSDPVIWDAEKVVPYTMEETARRIANRKSIERSGKNHSDDPVKEI